MISLFAPQKTINTLDHYLQVGFHQIAGWLLPPALECTLALAEIQQSWGVTGPVGEIGLWNGRYLALLSFLNDGPCPLVGVDSFVHCSDSAKQRETFLANMRQFARDPSLLRLIERDSALVTPHDLLKAGESKYQFFSVDGDHTLDGCWKDLKLVEQVLAEGGIVAVDDFPNMSCPGVIEAVTRYLSQPESLLAPFLAAGNKLFLAHQGVAAEFYREILSRANAGGFRSAGKPILDYHQQMQSLKIPVRFFGADLLVHT